MEWCETVRELFGLKCLYSQKLLSLCQSAGIPKLNTLDSPLSIYPTVGVYQYKQTTGCMNMYPAS